MTHINPPTNHDAQLDAFVRTEAAKELHTDLERMRRGITIEDLRIATDVDSAIDGELPKMHGALFSDAMFALWRLLANDRRDLFDLAISAAERWHAGDIEEAKRDDRRMAS